MLSFLAESQGYDAALAFLRTKFPPMMLRRNNRVFNTMLHRLVHEENLAIRKDSAYNPERTSYRLSVLLGGMKRMGAGPNVVTYNILLKRAALRKDLV